jgi:hypothetical protein
MIRVRRPLDSAIHYRKRLPPFGPQRKDVGDPFPTLLALVHSHDAPSAHFELRRSGLESGRPSVYRHPFGSATLPR